MRITGEAFSEGGVMTTREIREMNQQGREREARDELTPVKRRQLRTRLRISVRDWQGSIDALERELEKLVAPPDASG